MLLLAWLAYGRLNNYWLATEADALTNQSKTLDLKLTALAKTRATVAAIDSWREGQSVWLDQLQALSEGFPPARDAILGQLTFAVRQGRSQVDLKGWVRDAEVIAKMEERVRAAPATRSPARAARKTTP